MPDAIPVVGKVVLGPAQVAGLIDTRTLHRAPLLSLLGQIKGELERRRYERGECYACGEATHTKDCWLVALLGRIEGALA